MASERYFDIGIKSNNGENTLLTVTTTTYQDPIITVTETGVTIDRGEFGDPAHHGAVTYTYNGSKKFVGISTSANATTPTYGIGYSFNLSESVTEFYIVEEENPKTTKTFDLSTLNLSAGTHTITVKARASSYADSPASNAVSYVVAGEEIYTISGTWLFNETISMDRSFDFTENVNFTSNSLSYTTMYLYGNETTIKYGNTTTYSFSPLVPDGPIGWQNEAYRTITFDGTQTVSKEFYEWLTANAVRQTITFTIDGTSYTALSGMTWGEWVASEYNTGGFFAGSTLIFVYKSGNVRYCIKNEWLEKVIIANTNYVTEIFSGVEPT